MHLSKIIFSLFFSVCLLFNYSIPANANTCSCFGPQCNPFPKTVDYFDASLYQGDWYEIASTKPRFSQNCVCSRARYELDGKKVHVRNTCNLKTENGPLDEVTAVAKASWFSPAILNVKFDLKERDVSAPLAFLINSLPNYWVVDGDKAFADYAVVTSLGKDPIFILSRTPFMRDDKYQCILDKLAARGFKTQKIMKTLHSLYCQYPE